MTKVHPFFTSLTAGGFLLIVLFSAMVTGCVPRQTAEPTLMQATTVSCMFTEPTRLTPPEDASIVGTPAPGLFFTNADQSILVMAWWYENEEYHLRAGEEGNKVAWFRPDRAELLITGRRIDGDAPPLQAEVPCCYAGKFQPTRLVFATPGCWEITGAADGRSITFVVQVQP